VPTGGRFTAVNRPAASGLGLADPDEPNVLGDRDVLAEAEKWGRCYARRFGLDSADVTSEALARFYAQRAKLVATVRSGLVLNERAYLNSLARNVALEMCGFDRNCTRQAYRRYEALCDLRVQETGARLTASEEDEIAAQVIAAQPPKRRAPVGFHRKTHVVSLADEATSNAVEVKRLGGPSDGRSLVEDVLDDIVEGSAEVETAAEATVALVESLVESGERSRARRLAWDALADLERVSVRVAPSSVTESRAAAVRRVVRAGGGMAVLARHYARGLVETSEQVDAIFAPYGELNDEERDEVVALLCSHARLADDIWDSALRAATVQRSRESA
jgi:hypothetical protein